MFKSEILHELETKINKYSLSKPIDISLFQDKIVKYDNSLFGPSNDKIYLIKDLNILFKTNGYFINDLILNYRKPAYNNFHFMFYGDIKYNKRENLYLVKTCEYIIYNKKAKIKIDLSYRKNISKPFIYYSYRTILYNLYNIDFIIYNHPILNQDNKYFSNICIQIFFRHCKKLIYISKKCYCDSIDKEINYLYKPDLLIFDTKFFINNFRLYN